IVDAAAPDAQHVHVRIVDGLDELAITLSGDARRKTIGRNPVAAFSEDRHAVDHKLEAPPPLVRLLAQLQRTQAHPRRSLIDLHAAAKQAGAEPIERLRAETIRPPESRLVNDLR